MASSNRGSSQQRHGLNQYVDAGCTGSCGRRAGTSVAQSVIFRSLGRRKRRCV